MIACLATLGQGLLAAPNSDRFPRALRALLDRLDDPGFLAAFLNQAASLYPNIQDAYAQTSAEIRTTHPGTPERPVPDAFRNCIVFKALSTLGLNPLLRTVFSIVGDHYGRRSAAIFFECDYPRTTLAGDVFVYHFGSKQMSIRAHGPEMRQHLPIFFLYEPGIMRWIATFTPQDRFLDVGANIGSYTMAALEPFSVNFNALTDNIRLNRVDDTVAPLRLALWNETVHGVLQLHGDHVGVAGQTFSASAAQSAQTGSDANRQAVRAARLDDLIEEGVVDAPTHLKIDVDGEEWRLIDGMPRTLANPSLKSIRIEVRDSEESRRAIAKLTAAGFDGAIDDDAKNLLFLRQA